MHGLIHTALIAFMAISIQTHSASCSSRADLESAFESAHRLVLAGDYDGGLMACGIAEDDSDVLFVIDSHASMILPY